MPKIDDSALVQIVDAALADSARRSGDLLVCKPGCFQCCVGVFAISQLDALRLRAALDALESTDAERAGRIRSRVAESLARISPEFPGDAASGLLPEFDGPSDEADAFEAAFDVFANDEVCPVLDPATGICDLYAARPIPCRTFGPPVKNAEGGLGVCELCFHGATSEQIAACEMHPDPEHLEERLLAELREETGAHGQTIISYALRG
ncbi:MAG TPA: YkgJ family cysteine cluster protein [Acidobacteriaceae bacterium]|jgi:Fe-S-cluster containining protein|nr:YkgJ family cysteine cluster protein [Acidobacteriaceae bacterium]